MVDDARELQFRMQPKSMKKARKYDILRTPAKGCGNLVLLSDEVLWHELHYWRGRSTPCFGDPCEACDYHCQVRERGYIAVTPRHKVDVQILELTDQCQAAIVAASETLTTLRGQVIATGRVDSKPNGKLFILFGARSIDSELLPQAPDVAEVMRRVWGMGRRKAMNTPAEALLDMKTVRCVVPSIQSNGAAT